MTNWQPIETAPRDGTRIIGACRYYTKILAYSEAIEADEHFPHRVPARWEDDGEGFALEPTHWLPIPPLPCGGEDEVKR